MQPTNQTPIEKIESSKKVAICIPQTEDVEILYATKVLYDFLIKKGKEAGVLVGGDINEKTEVFFNENSIAFKEDTSPTSYVVSIDYAKTGLEKVTYDIDEKTGKLKFYLTPSKGEFDFNDVEYVTEGNNFDLTVTIGVESFTNLGKLYQSSNYLFSDNTTIAIFKGSGSLGDYTIAVPQASSLIYGVRTLLAEQVNESNANEILASILKTEPVIEGIPRKGFLNEAQELIGAGADWATVVKEAYYDKDYLNLDIQIKLMHHILVDRESKVIWSKLENKEFKYAGLTEGKFDPTGRILFNISSDFDLVFAVYEVEKDKLEIVVESNNITKYSAINIAGVYGGDGDDRHATFVIDNMPIKDFEKKVFLVLNDMYGLDVNGNSVEFRGSSTEKVEESLKTEK